MNILVYSVAADSGGALSVLMDFYKQFKEKKQNHYYFVVSTPRIEECDNITVLRFPEIKKGWGHRLLFEYIKAPQLVKKYKIDEVFSTTNTVIPRTDVKQVLYLHQSLPFIKYRFKFWKDKQLWIYQNIISKFIIYATHRANQIIVQTNWMKKAVASAANIDENKIIVQIPIIELSKIPQYIKTLHNITFFYPAGSYTYKNHLVIVKACRELQNEGINNYSVIFTLRGDENSYSKELKNMALQYDLPINFIGVLPREKVLSLYSSTILLFPSLVETLGLPLIEARTAHCPIIAADTIFGNEILSEYNDVHFFKINDYIGLKNIMKLFIIN